MKHKFLLFILPLIIINVGGFVVVLLPQRHKGAEAHKALTA